MRGLVFVTQVYIQYKWELANEDRDLNHSNIYSTMVIDNEIKGRLALITGASGG
jgi:hypothetical protein